MCKVPSAWRVVLCEHDVASCDERGQLTKRIRASCEGEPRTHQRHRNRVDDGQVMRSEKEVPTMLLRQSSHGPYTTSLCQQALNPSISKTMVMSSSSSSSSSSSLTSSSPTQTPRLVHKARRTAGQAPSQDHLVLRFGIEAETLFWRSTDFWLQSTCGGLTGGKTQLDACSRCRWFVGDDAQALHGRLTRAPNVRCRFSNTTRRMADCASQ